MSAGRLRFFPPTSAKKERDEELALFRELFKREREKNMNLLESVSTEFEPVEGNSVVFKISAGKKGDSHGNEMEKNDYDWLKTPPATPLFQSLEMDVGQGNNPNMIIQKELPIIPLLKPSRFSEKMELKTRSKPPSPSSPSVASFRSATSSRPETPDPYPYPLSPPRSTTTPITTPRFGSQRFAKVSDKEPSVKPLQPGRFMRRKEEPQPRQSPGSLSVASTEETPDVNPKPPSIRKAANIVRGREDPKPVERSINRFSREGPTKQKPDPKLQTRQVKSVVTKPRPTSPSSSRPVTSVTSSRPDSPDSKPVIKSKVVPRSLEKPVKKPIKETPAKQNPESKPNNRTDSPLVRSRFPATLPDFPTEAPPNLITSVAPDRSTSATRSRPGVPAMASTEHRRSPSTTKTGRSSEMEEEKGKGKRGGNNHGVVIGSSMVERMLNARKSTATGKVTARGEKDSKIRGLS